MWISCGCPPCLRVSFICSYSTRCFGRSASFVLPGKEEWPIAAQRLSKLQKWILIYCYRVTVLHDRTNLVKLQTVAPGDLQRFWRFDVLLSWFGLESSWQHGFESVHRMETSREYYSAQATLCRSLNRLYEKGYILNPQGWCVIELTLAGKAKAEELLNAID